VAATVLGGACARRSGDLGSPLTVFSPIGSSPSPAATASSSASSSLDPGASSTPTLASPGVWRLPPAGMSLSWIDAAGQSAFGTISTALPDRMDGMFDCENLASVDSKLTVSAQGTFMASR
jgi:hypothetical protein